jgi:hypothetical protein
MIVKARVYNPSKRRTQHIRILMLNLRLQFQRLPNKQKKPLVRRLFIILVWAIKRQF